MIRPTVDQIVATAIVPLETAIEFLDEVMARQVIAGLDLSGVSENIVVYDDFSRVLAEVGSANMRHDEFHTWFLETLGLSVFYHIDQEIPLKNGRSGRLHMDLDLMPMLTPLMLNALTISLLWSFAFAAIIFAFFAWLRHQIDNDLFSLVGFTDAMLRGHPNADSMSEKIAFLEVQSVANSLTKTIKRLRESDSQIKSFKQMQSNLFQALDEAFFITGARVTVFDVDGAFAFSNADGSEDEFYRALVEGKRFDLEGLRLRLQPYNVSVNEIPVQDARTSLGQFSESYELRLRDQSWMLYVVHLTNGSRLLLSYQLTAVRKQADAELHQEKLAALGRVASGIAHEFNNALEIIIANIELHMSGETAATDSAQLRIALQASKRATAVIRQVKQIGRVKMPNSQPVDAAKWLSNIFPLIRAGTGRQVALKTHCEEGTVLVGDEALLDLAILNLCQNADDAMNSEGLIEITIGTAPISEVLLQELSVNRPYVRITVRDTGPGIPADVIGKIFEPFFSTKFNAGGTGLGLSTVHSFAINSKGAIRCISQPGQGATFTILLPALEAALRTPQIENPREPAILGRRNGRKSILLVDDEEGILSAFQLYLTRLGHNVDIAQSVQAAISCIAENEDYDIAILDMHLQDGNGLNIARVLCEQNPEVRTVLVSGDVSSIDPDTPTVDVIYEKPISLSRLKEIVECAPVS